MPKDVTPKKKNDFMKKFAIGLAGGLIGGALVCGIFYAVLENRTDNSSSVTSSQIADKNGTKVSSIKYDVNSDVTQAVDKVKGAVVSVVNQQKKQQSNDLSDLFGFGGNSSQATENGTNSDDDLETASEGSGVIYKKDGDKAYIVTNNHVVEGSQALEVILNDGTTVKGKLLGTDTYTDLAVIEIPSEKVTDVAEFGDSNDIKIGEPALAIGSPLGSDYANSVTQGIISAVNRTISNRNGNDITQINAIQTDAAINPGNSGGPLINVAGQVIGINSIKIAQSNSNISVEGMGFAIPSNDVVRIINQLEKNGKVARPYLGVSMIDLEQVSEEQQEKVLEIPKDVKEGVIIGEVAPASPADKAGVKKFDVIIDVDGKKVATADDLQSALYQKEVGNKAKLTLYRGKEKKTIEVNLNVDRNEVQKEQKNQ